jgi:hypothetical protein
MKYVTAATLAVAFAMASACSDRALETPITAPSATSVTVLHHDSGVANPTVFITDDGLEPRRLEVFDNSPVTFVNRSSVNRWIRSDPHVPGGHNECPEFEAIGTLAPGQSGKTGVLSHERCDYHDHLMGAELTSDFEGRVRIRN